jgi:bacillopeptidase F
VSLANNGAATSTGISAVLSSSTPGVSITQNNSTYPNIAAGGNANNNAAYVVSVADTVVCGAELQFSLAVTTAQGNYTLPFTLQASVPQPAMNAFFDNFENGVNGWTTGGTGNTWAQTTEAAYSPTHSWTDSPGVSYPNNVNSWLQSPVIDLTGKYDINVSGFYKYALEPGFDYAYLEWSTNGGTTWAAAPLADFNGVENNFTQVTKAASPLENQSNVRLRYRLFTDGGVVFDGFYVDDFAVSYVPVVCEPVVPTAVELSSVETTPTAAPYTALLALLAVAALGGVMVLRTRGSRE